MGRQGPLRSDGLQGWQVHITSRIALEVKALYDIAGQRVQCSAEELNTFGVEERLRCHDGTSFAFDSDTAAENASAGLDRVVQPHQTSAVKLSHPTLTRDGMERPMKQLVLNLPTFGFVVMTRALLGVGIGLLISERLSPEQRRAVGLTLVLVGVATTIPAAIAVVGGIEGRKVVAA